jgi:hypothetical protein
LGHFVPGQPPAVVVARVETEKATREQVEVWVRESAHVAYRGGEEMVARPNAGEIQLTNFLSW